MVAAARRLLILTAFGIVATTGCASTGAGASAPRTQRNVMTVEELAQAGDVSLYDALERLRPQFLRGRAPLGSTAEAVPVSVYIGDLKMEGVEHLREVMVRAVKQVQYLDAQQANARFGGNNASGALIVTMM